MVVALEALKKKWNDCLACKMTLACKLQLPILAWWQL